MVIIKQEEGMIEIVEQQHDGQVQGFEPQHPLCPFCSIPVKKIFMQQIRAFLGKRYIYYCAECLKVLGISHRKGFWMG